MHRKGIFFLPQPPAKLNFLNQFMTSTMKKVVLSLLFGVFMTALFGQEIQVKGKVVDATDQQPLSGVRVLSDGGKGVLTDGSGNFSLLVKEGEKITFSSYGYIGQTVAASADFLTVSLAVSTSLLDAVVIVGNRNPNRTALNTPVPVDIIPLKAIQQTLPQNDLNQLLTYLAPSFQSNRQSSADGTEHIDPASLRGLGPDQTLVLINGKRRHTTSLLNYQGTAGNGSVGTDLNTIPVSAIDRIEVLRDGASAQYGSDAIAGVVNVVLKKGAEGLNIAATTGITHKGDGELARVQGSYGLDLGKQGGSLNLAGEAYFRGSTNRTQNHDLIIFDQSALGNFFAYAFTDDEAASRAFDDSVLSARGLTRDDFNFQVGDAQILNLNLFYNLDLPFAGGKGRFYSFGGYNARRGEGYGFRRLPTDGHQMVFSIFPNGYQPNTGSDIQDQSVAVGVQYQLGNWNLDLSNTFGNNSFDYSVNNTVNASLQDQSPTSFEAGGHAFSQNTVNADASRFFAGVAKGLNVAFGGEFRYENYRITEGQEESWRNYGLVTLPDGTVENVLGFSGGAQSFPGFSPANVVNASRTNVSLYGDTELDITTAWSLGVAGRFENYSDFGSTFNYKVATKYNFDSKFVVRGAYSTGFRAPSLHQQYFSYVSTTILSDGRLGESGIFPNNSDVAQAIGIPELKQETAQNLSLGLTLKASEQFSVSLDA